MASSSEHDDRRPVPVIAGGRLSVVLPADPSAPATARTRYAAWLAAHDWPATPRDDLVLAVSEAVSNSVEHGYGVRAEAAGQALVVVAGAAVVEIEAEVVRGADGTRHVETTVRDHGSWRPPPRLRSYRRHGMAIMKGCVAECVVDGTRDGTTVALRSRPVPA